MLTLIQITFYLSYIRISFINSWQGYSDNPGTLIIEGIMTIHHELIMLVIVLSIFILWTIIRDFIFFHEIDNPKPDVFLHGTFQEKITTGTLIFILLLLLLPLYGYLLCMEDDSCPNLEFVLYQLIPKTYCAEWAYDLDYKRMNTTLPKLIRSQDDLLIRHKPIPYKFDQTVWYKTNFANEFSYNKKNNNHYGLNEKRISQRVQQLYGLREQRSFIIELEKKGCPKAMVTRVLSDINNNLITVSNSNITTQEIGTYNSILREGLYGNPSHKVSAWNYGMINFTTFELQTRFLIDKGYSLENCLNIPNLFSLDKIGFRPDNVPQISKFLSIPPENRTFGSFDDLVVLIEPDILDAIVEATAQPIDVTKSLSFHKVAPEYYYQHFYDSKYTFFDSLEKHIHTSSLNYYLYEKNNFHKLLSGNPYNR